MDFKLKTALLILCSLLLTACLGLTTEDDEENAEACGSGDQAACEELDNELDIANEACNAGNTQSCARAAALEALIASIPTGLVVASNTSVTGAGNTSEFADKQNEITDFLENTALTGADVSACFDALPAQPQVQSPLCYGPAVDYVQHPNYDSNQTGPGSQEDGQLPTGDLGLWVETEPGTNTACAAAKLNELVAKAAYNVDLAVGSMTMTVCAAAMLGKELPTQVGEKLDLGNALENVAGTDLSVKSATIELATLTNGHTAYKTSLDATDNNDSPVKLSVTHDSEDNTGILLIETSDAGQNGAGADARSTSVVYSVGSSLKYKMISARAQNQHGGDPQQPPPQTNSLRMTEEAEVNLSNTGEVSLNNNDDTHIMIAELNAETGNGSLAYAWKAGGNDSHFRALNVTTDTTTGRAYYGYVPSPAASSEVINLDLNDTDAGMICNWAGPSNNHDPLDKVQYQSLTLTDGEWTASTSNIQYGPTNDCDIAAAASTFTPTFADPNVSPAPTPTSGQQEVIDNGTLSGPFTNDLLNKSSIQFTMPTAPSVPQ